MLKFKLWSNHILFSQSLSSNLDLKEMRLSISHTSIRSLWVSTQNQPGTALYDLNFDFSKFSLLNLNEACIAINIWSFSLILIFSSSLAFLLALWCYRRPTTSRWRAAQQLGRVQHLGCVSQVWGVYGTPKGEEEKGRKKRGMGSSLGMERGWLR